MASFIYRHFQLLGFVAVLVVAIALSAVVQNQSANRFLESVQARNQLVAYTLQVPASTNHASLLASVTTPEFRRQFQSHVKNLQSSRQIASLQIRDTARGAVLASTNNAPEVSVDSTGFQQALSGQTFSRIDFDRTVSNSDGSVVQRGRTLVSTYIPLRSGSARPYAVAHIQADVSKEFSTTRTANVKTTLVIILAMLLLHISMVLIARQFNSVSSSPVDLSNRQNSVSYHDPLTGLPTRNLFLDRLKHGINKVDRSGDMLAVLTVDIDRFKRVNDSLGYEQGDKVIKLFAGRLRKIIRDCDTVGRLSGDEFSVILEGVCNINEAAHVAKRVEKSLASPFDLDDQEVNLSASIGISIYPEDTKNSEQLLNQAIHAMHKAKEQGGASYLFYAGEMNISSSKRLIEENKLRLAIERNEYVVFYQPMIDVNRNTITGMEALIRWQRDGETLVPPGRFISMLEESGLILPVGEWVLREACRQTQDWNSRFNLNLKVSVNVSVRQFRQLDFVDTIYKILDETGLPPSLLEIEVTEGVLMEDTQVSSVTLEELRTLGVGISIDDFGTGYSSLNYLRKYPVSTIKIDRSFVSDIDRRSEGAAISTTIVALAHNLHLDIVAEGVETFQQLSFLNALGCKQVQGYLFSQPVKAQEFEKLILDEEFVQRILSEKKSNIA